jgi:hypothetical protein
MTIQEHELLCKMLKVLNKYLDPQADKSSFILRNFHPEQLRDVKTFIYSFDRYGEDMEDLTDEQQHRIGAIVDLAYNDEVKT